MCQKELELEPALSLLPDLGAGALMCLPVALPVLELQEDPARTIVSAVKSLLF